MSHSEDSVLEFLDVFFSLNLLRLWDFRSAFYVILQAFLGILRVNLSLFAFPEKQF